MGAPNGDVHFSNYSIISFDQIGTIVEHSRNISNGLVGNNGCNRYGIKFPINLNVTDMNASQILNDYKDYAEEEFSSSILISDSDFLTNLLGNERTQFLIQFEHRILDERFGELVSFDDDVEIFISAECEMKKKTNANMESETEKTKLVNLFRDLIQEIHNRMIVDVHSIDDKIKQFYVDLESSHEKLLYEIILDGYLKISNIGLCEPKKYENQLIDAVYKLRLDISIDDFKEHVKFLDFLYEFNGHGMVDSFKIDYRLTKTIEFLRDAKKWYGYLDDLKGILYDYGSLGGNDQVIGNLIRKCNVTGNEKIKVSDIGLNQLLERMNSTVPPALAETKIDSPKLKALKALLHQTLIDRVRIVCGKNELLVKGYDVNISEFNQIYCEARKIEICALHKVFIDADIDKTGEGVQITIVAPIWEIVGDRRIILNGASGVPHFFHAPDGYIGKENGDDGLPGNPGGSAGHFIAIGNRFVNDELLKIKLNGGQGSNGQSGGKGISRSESV